MPYSIADIEKLYPNWFSHSHNLPYDDQKWIWENVPLSKEDEDRLSSLKSNTAEANISLNENENDTYKNETKSKLNLNKLEAIFKIKKCNYKTSPKEIASYLEVIFSKWPSKEGHWLFIAQNYTPKTINCLLSLITKQHQKGEVSIQNAAAYFTGTILRFRPKRKKFRNTIDSRKQKEWGYGK